MTRRPPRSTRTDTLFPYTTLFRSVAAALVHGRLGVAEIDGTGLRDAEVLALSDAMVLVEEPTYSRRFPAERWAHAEIELRDGRRLRSEPCPARGDPEAPFSDTELLAKFHGLADPMLGTARSGAIAEGCLTIDEAADLAPFLDTVLAAPLEARQAAS